MYSGGLTKLGWLKGVGPADRSSSRENLTGDPYWTDGYRAVLLFGGAYADLDELEVLPWEHPIAEKAQRTQMKEQSEMKKE